MSKIAITIDDDVELIVIVAFNSEIGRASTQSVLRLKDESNDSLQLRIDGHLSRFERWSLPILSVSVCRDGQWSTNEVTR